ncbi:MAG: Gfo/Idh/MocA family oxidoreductase [Opitutaceae bacterium]|nr:Gfo/Idh/MocA family oxidoreductase [Opitutaceae bacterium]
MNTPPLSLSRRQFLRHSAAAAALAVPTIHRAAAAGSANEDVRVAIIGLGNKGNNHLKVFRTVAGARLVALCDVDPQRLAAAAVKLKEGGAAPFTATDPRKILERPDVDAVVIATPNHWHALLGVWACRAGKDVYVEKPVSHSIWEGAQLVAAGRKHGRVVQAGTQYRSDEGLQAAAAWLREGHLGALQWAHVLWYELREGIGRTAPHVPDGLDYDLYCGPAPFEPLTRPKLHYDWHWFWSTGDGDLGNSGIHAFDACRWLAGATGMPRRARCLGGRFGVDDAAQTPNTQLTLIDYPGVPILIENRNLPSRKGMKAMDTFRGLREGFVVQYEGGYFAGLRGGGNVYDNQGAKLRSFPGDSGSQHQANFIQAVKSRRPDRLHAPIVEGHVSTAGCHLGNISWRLGKPAPVAECLEAMSLHPRAAETVALLERNLAANDVDVKQRPFVLGPWLELATGAEEIRAVTGADRPALATAQRLVRGSHRAGYGF